MRKVIATFNMTLDGNCDHTVGLADIELHQHYTELLSKGDIILYGKTTYQLMEYWRTFLENPSEDKSMNDFAIAINRIPKIVFSHTLKSLDWESATIAKSNLKETVLELKKESGNDIFIGSRSLIIQLLNLNLIDELQICIQPVVAGIGLQLFENINERTIFKLENTKVFKNGAIILYYNPKENNEH